MVKVLVVEDEASIREMIALNLRLAGMEAVEADSAEAALPLLEQRPGCDAAILDVMLPGMNGFSLCETIRRTDQKIGIIILGEMLLRVLLGRGRRQKNMEVLDGQGTCGRG